MCVPFCPFHLIVTNLQSNNIVCNSILFVILFTVGNFDDVTKGTMGSRDVTLAYDDDSNRILDSGDVTLAYKDDAMGF